MRVPSMAAITISLITLSAAHSSAESPVKLDSTNITQPATPTAWTDSQRVKPGPNLLGSPPKFDAGRLVQRTVIASTGLAVACAIALWLGRRANVRNGSPRSTHDLSLLDSLNIAPRCCLQLVAVADQRFLVARDATGVRSVTAVSSFRDALSEVEATAESPSRETRDTLSSMSDAGLSLEDSQRLDTLDDLSNLKSRRMDPWQGNLPNRRSV